MIETCNTFADPTKFPDTNTLLKMQDFLQNEKNVKEIIGVNTCVDNGVRRRTSCGVGRT